MDFQIGKNSVVKLGSTNEEVARRIDIQCGDNCLIDIAGISRNLDRLVIFMADNTVLKVGAGQMMHSSVNIYLHEKSTIEIGEACLFAECDIWSSDMHSVIDAESNKRFNFAENITIGSNVWIGYQALILKGSRVEDGCVIGAKSVVTKSMKTKANCLIAGNPARVIRTGITWDERLL